VADFCKSNIAATAALSATIGNGYVSPSVQWQESLDSGSSWTDIPGATTSNYLFSKSAVGTYQYRITVAEGNNITMSNCRIASNPVLLLFMIFPLSLPRATALFVKIRLFN